MQEPDTEASHSHQRDHPQLVIFLTASGLEEDVRTAIRLGAVNYLMKPFQPQELMKRIAQLLGFPENPRGHSI